MRTEAWRDKVERIYGRRCEVEGCGQPHLARGLCNTHYKRSRNRKHGMTGGGVEVSVRGWRPPKPLLSKLMDGMTIDDGGCWVFGGTLDGHGYGQILVGSRRDGTNRPVKAHRASYEMFVGPIPTGLDLDHLCRVTRCINPQHLEPVTRAENLRRGAAARREEASR